MKTKNKKKTANYVVSENEELKVDKLGEHRYRYEFYHDGSLIQQATVYSFMAIANYIKQNWRNRSKVIIGDIQNQLYYSR